MKIMILNSIKELVSIIKDDSIKGFNVTIPYKKVIIDFLHEIDPIAKKNWSN